MRIIDIEWTFLNIDWLNEWMISDWKLNVLQPKSKLLIEKFPKTHIQDLSRVFKIWFWWKYYTCMRILNFWLGNGTSDFVWWSWRDSCGCDRWRHKPIRTLTEQEKISNIAQMSLVSVRSFQVSIFNLKMSKFLALTRGFSGINRRRQVFLFCPTDNWRLSDFFQFCRESADMFGFLWSHGQSEIIFFIEKSTIRTQNHCCL